MRRRFNQNEFQGLGVYQQVTRRGASPAFAGSNYEHYNPGNVFGGMSAYEMVGGMGEMPDLSSLTAMISSGGLQLVKYEGKASAKTALELLKFTQDDPAATDPIAGQAIYVLFSFVPTNWVTSFVDAGYVVMVSMSSATSNSGVRVIATKTPSVVAQYAKSGGDYIIVDGAQSVIDAASALLATPPPPPPGTPGTQVEPVAKPMPGWVLPVAIGGGLLLVTLLVVSMQKKSSPAIQYTAY